MNFGDVGGNYFIFIIYKLVSIGSLVTKDQIITTLKRNSYGCLFGGEKWGSCSILMGPDYENNNISHVFDTESPRIYLSGIGGRSPGPNGFMIQKYDQIEWQNRGLIVCIYIYIKINEF